MSTTSVADKQAALAKGLEGVIGGTTAVCSIEAGGLLGGSFGHPSNAGR